jgi:sugar/nucleoside kinase (ribokinase family)
VHFAGYFNIPGFWDGQLERKLEEIRRADATSKTKSTISLVPQHDATNKWDGGIIALLKYVDFLILSELEAQRISGYRSEHDKANEETEMVDQTAAFFHKQSPSTFVVVTRGAKGAVALYGGKIVCSQSAAREIDNPVDPTGAGDAFAAGFLYGLVECDKEGTSTTSVTSIKRGLRYGCATGTCCVMISGASIPPSKHDIERVLNEMGEGDL